MPLDQAVYSASQDKIYGVRGGYVYEFNPTTGAKINSARYGAPAFGDASIAYDTVNDKIFCSVWREMGFANGGDTNFQIITAKKLFRIVPATLAVDASAEINGEVGFPGYIAADEQWIGPHRLLYYSGLIYCASGGNTNSRFCSVNVSTLAVVTNGDTLPWNMGFWLDFCVQTGGAEPSIWIGWPDRRVRPLKLTTLTNGPSIYYDYLATDYAAPYNILYGVCYCVSNGKIYGTTRSQTVIAWTPNTVGSPFALTTINTGDASATPYRIAYNPYDGLIYVPGYASNNVVVIDPATDTVAATKTGFDSPFDCVFTPTKKWAVQQGGVPLREIT